MSSFKKFLENRDIFGFDKEPIQDDKFDEFMNKPIKQFNVELMMEFLCNKTLAGITPHMNFVNEIRWGNQPGSIKLEVDTGYTFYIKKLGMDKQGNPRWVTKRMFQLNRQGYGGLEDKVSQEIFEHISKYYQENIDAPIEDYNDLENLANYIYNKAKRTSKVIFFPEGIKKINDDCYVMKMGVRGQGLESPSQTRIEQNQTMLTYDREQGTIRMFNYNISSPVGKGHSWKLDPNDLDLYFFPTQGRDEISECLSVHLKYY